MKKLLYLLFVLLICAPAFAGPPAAPCKLQPNAAGQLETTKTIKAGGLEINDGTAGDALTFDYNKTTRVLDLGAATVKAGGGIALANETVPHTASEYSVYVLNNIPIVRVGTTDIPLISPFTNTSGIIASARTSLGLASASIITPSILGYTLPTPLAIWTPDTAQTNIFTPATLASYEVANPYVQNYGMLYSPDVSSTVAWNAEASAIATKFIAGRNSGTDADNTVYQIVDATSTNPDYLDCVRRATSGTAEYEVAYPLYSSTTTPLSEILVIMKIQAENGGGAITDYNAATAVHITVSNDQLADAFTARHRVNLVYAPAVHLTGFRWRSNILGIQSVTGTDIATAATVLVLRIQTIDADFSRVTIYDAAGTVLSTSDEGANALNVAAAWKYDTVNWQYFLTINANSVAGTQSKVGFKIFNLAAFVK